MLLLLCSYLLLAYVNFRYTDNLEHMDPNQVRCAKEKYIMSCKKVQVGLFCYETDFHVQLCQAEELFDIASRYLLFPLKRVVADILLPYLEHVSPAELCHWLMLSDMYV